MTPAAAAKIAKTAVPMSELRAAYGAENCGIDAWQRGHEKDLPRGVKYGFYRTRATGFVACFVRPGK